MEPVIQVLGAAKVHSPQTVTLLQYLTMKDLKVAIPTTPMLQAVLTKKVLQVHKRGQRIIR